MISPDTVAINEERTKKERQKEERRRERKQKEKSTFGGKMFICENCKVRKLKERNVEMRIGVLVSHVGICAICGEKGDLCWYERVRSL